MGNKEAGAFEGSRRAEHPQTPLFQQLTQSLRLTHGCSLGMSPRKAKETEAAASGMALSRHCSLSLTDTPFGHRNHLVTDSLSPGRCFCLLYCLSTLCPGVPTPPSWVVLSHGVSLHCPGGPERPGRQ
jgi:hypothetical protein